MSEEEENTRGFKVADRRRFDTEGNERVEESETKKVTPASQPKGNAGEQPRVSRPGEPSRESVVAAYDKDGGEFELDFSSFIMSLATQALMQMGAVQAPEGMDVPADKAAARQTIDILAMLQRKTKGNLEPAEDHLLEEILHNLRLNFVKTA